MDTIEVDDRIWVGTSYRTVVEVCGIMDDGRLKVRTRDDSTGQLFSTAITVPTEEAPEPKAEGTQRRTRRPKPRLTPQLRLEIHGGLKCRYGHDLRSNLPNGKPAVYISPAGAQSCRWCKRDLAEQKAAAS